MCVHVCVRSEKCNELVVQEVKEKKIQLLLLKIKNGTPPLRRSALRILTDKAKEFGAAALFNQILPLMMQTTLEDQVGGICFLGCMHI